MNYINFILIFLLLAEWKTVYSLDQTCIDRPRDIIVVLDSSDSISDSDFESAKRSISFILSYFTIATGKARASMVNFGKEAQIHFDLDKFKDKANMNFVIRLAKRVGGATMLGSALQLANSAIVPKMRSEAGRMMIVISSGENSASPQPSAIASLIKAQNVTVFSVGIGNKIKLKELQDISSSNTVITFESFRELEKQAFTVTEEMCPNIVPVSQGIPTRITDIGTTTQKERETTTTKQVTTAAVTYADTTLGEEMTTKAPISIKPNTKAQTSLKPKIDLTTEPAAEETTTTKEKKPIPPVDKSCIDRPRDIIVLLDSSDTLSNTEFESSKLAVTNLLSFFPIMPAKARASMIVFGKDGKVQFDLEKYDNKANMNFGIRLANRVGGENGLESALNLANENLVVQMRENAGRMMIIVSNGGNKSLSTAKNIVAKIKSQKVSIFSIGIGDKINVKELQEISSSNVVITFENFREMEKQIFRITDEMCPSKEIVPPVSKATAATKETEPIIMSTKKLTTKYIERTSIANIEESTTAFEILKPDAVCNETKIDLMFAFDSSSSLSEDHWSQETQLGVKVVDDLKIGMKYSQVGMLSFSSMSVINIHLGSLMDKEAIKKEMMKQELMEGSTFMAEALIACKDELLAKGRQGVKKTIVLVTDGAANSPKLLVEEEAEKIKKLGIKIIVVGLGYSILKKQLINISSSEMYYPIENMDRISFFDTKALSKEACHIPKPVRMCDTQQDIIIILDISSQVSNTEHVQQLLFAKKIIDLFDLAENLTRISLISYGDETNMLTPFTTNYNDLFKLLQYLKYRGGQANLDVAFGAARKAFYLGSERADARKLVILLSNGLSKKPAKSIGESYDLQEIGIDILTVGVSEKADREELRLLASPGMYLHRGDVKIDDSLVKDAVKMACSPASKIQKTVCEASGDVIFVIDKSKQPKDDSWEGMKSTLLTTLRSLNISQQLSRVSIISYSDQVKTEFRLDENFSARDIFVALKQLKQDGVGGQLGSALEQARQQLKVNSRYNMAKVLIILTDKLPDNQKLALSQADDLKNDGVKIITVGLSKDAPTSFFETLSSPKSQITINDISKVMKHKEELRMMLCDALTNKQDQCTLKVLDVVVSMDSSSSVGPDNWKIQLDFINRLVGNLDLRQGRTRLGIFTFGTFVELRIPINSTFTAEEMQKEVQKIPFVEGMTAIGLAIQEAAAHLDQRGRDNTPRVIVILTDGSNTKGISPQITAVEAKKAGIKIISVGIGGEISERELKDISSSGNFYNVQDFQDLEKYNAKSITNDACQIPEKPKICDGAGDLIFIMGSGADKGTLRWNKMADFMKTLTNLTVVGKDNTRVDVMKFNKGAYIDSGFKDNYAQFEQSIETMTSSVDGVFIGKALERARSLFNEDERTNATKSVILISDSLIRDRNKTLFEAELLKKAGIKIFVIGVTQNVSREDLQQVASKGKDLFVNDFQYLNNYNAFISAELCEVIKGTSKECSNRQLEVMIAMDSSSSIGPYHWQTQLSFVEKIIKDMDISQTMTRVGLITFNTKSFKQFGLSKYSDKYALTSAIKKLEFSEGLTAIGDALRDCKLELLNNTRRGAPQIILLITDGVSKGGIPPEDESMVIKKYGIKIITIGIGDSISQSQLKFLSSSSNVFNVLDYTSLKDYDSSFITRESCQVGKVL